MVYNSFIPLYFLNAGDNNFLKPFTTFVQKISPGLLLLRSDVFRLELFLDARFLVVAVFFFALGILFSLCFI